MTDLERKETLSKIKSYLQTVTTFSVFQDMLNYLLEYNLTIDNPNEFIYYLIYTIVENSGCFLLLKCSEADTLYFAKQLKNNNILAPLLTIIEK